VHNAAQRRQFPPKIIEQLLQPFALGNIAAAQMDRRAQALDLTEGAFFGRPDPPATADENEVSSAGTG
jgi:hypothetical protein